ncbi:MAG: hypothetical protein JSR96_00800 [Proteobacteria bacterium]|nr:hypothetical protein [Pseudomonadota bacterium]
MPSHRECHRIVMLIASGWPFLLVVPERTSFHHPNIRSGVRSRQAASADPGDPCLATWRFRDRFDALPFLTVQSATREAPPSFQPFPTAVEPIC